MELLHSWLSGPPLLTQLLGEAFERFSSSAPFMTNGTGLIWFRTCRTLDEKAGKDFAKLRHCMCVLQVLPLTRSCVCEDRLVDTASLGSGYTHNIGAKQLGLVCLAPGQEPQWQDGDSTLSTSFLDSSPKELAPIYVP